MPLLEFSRLANVNDLSVVTVDQLGCFSRTDFRAETLAVQNREGQTGGSHDDHGKQQAVINEKLHHFLNLYF